MNRAEFLSQIVHPTLTEAERILTGKGDEYSNAQEVTTNFRNNAKKLGVSPYVVHSVYMGKHLDSIERYIRERVAGNWPKTEEPIAGRVMDVINYLLLFLAIDQEEFQAQFEKPSDPAPSEDDIVDRRHLVAPSPRFSPGDRVVIVPSDYTALNQNWFMVGNTGTVIRETTLSGCAPSYQVRFDPAPGVAEDAHGNRDWVVMGAQLALNR